MAIIELDQAHDTQLSTYSRGPFTIRYAYVRDSGSQVSGGRGQDYMIIRAEPQRLAFAVCDGVGQSFFGDLAAQLVGERLAQWLWALPSDPTGLPTPRQSLAKSLHEYLDQQIDLGTRLVMGKTLSGYPLIREVQEQNRAESGTQSNFVCGLLEAASTRLPHGRVLLFWLGDAMLHTWRQGVDASEQLGATWSSEEAWSSKEGVVGEIHSFVGDLRQVDSILAHTDGFNHLKDRWRPGLDAAIIDKSIGSPEDDVSYLEVSISVGMPHLEEDLVGELREDARPGALMTSSSGSPSGGGVHPISRQFVIGAVMLLVTIAAMSLVAGIRMGKMSAMPTSVMPTEAFSRTPTFTATATPLPSPTPTQTPTVTRLPTATAMVRSSATGNSLDGLYP